MQISRSHGTRSFLAEPFGGKQMDDMDHDRAMSELGLDRVVAADDVIEKATVPWWRRASSWMLAYGVVLAAIAFWPQPVDSGVSPFVRVLTRLVPLLTYERIEFGSNVVLFVPLGIVLGLLLPASRHLVVPLAFLSSLTIEAIQAVMLADRTPSVFDLIANVAGACLGLVLLSGYEWMARHRPD